MTREEQFRRIRLSHIDMKDDKMPWEEDDILATKALIDAGLVPAEEIAQAINRIKAQNNRQE